MTEKWEQMTIAEFKAMKQAHEIDIMNWLNKKLDEIRETTDLSVGNLSVVVRYDTFGVPPRVTDVTLTFAVDLP